MTQAIVIDNLLPQQLRIDYRRGDNSATVFVILRQGARLFIEGVGYEQLSENVRLVMETRRHVRVRVLPRDVVGNRPTGPTDFIVTGAPSIVAGTGSVTGTLGYTASGVVNATITGSVLGTHAVSGHAAAAKHLSGTVLGTGSVAGDLTYTAASGPSLPSANMLFHYQADMAYTDAGKTTLCAVDGVDTAYVLADQSGNGYDLIQAASASRPLWYAAPLNGLPGLRFRAGASGGGMDTGTFARGSTETIYMVIKPVSTNAGSRIIDGGADRREMQAYTSGSHSTNIQYNLYGGAVVGHDGPAEQPYGQYGIVTLIFDSGSGALLQVGLGIEDTGSSGGLSATKFNIGEADSYAAEFEVAEIIGYSVGHNLSARQTIQAYLGTKYDLLRYALFSPTDKAASSTLSNGNTRVTLSTGHARIDAFNKSGKRQIEIRYVSGTTSGPVLSLGRNVAVPFPAISGDFWTFDGSGYFGHNGGYTFVGGALTAGDVLTLLWDGDAGNLSFMKNGVLIGGAPWSPGSVAPGEFMSVSVAPWTNVSSCVVDVITDPADFVYPQAGYTGFKSDLT